MAAAVKWVAPSEGVSWVVAEEEAVCGVAAVSASEEVATAQEVWARAAAVAAAVAVAVLLVPTTRRGTLRSGRAP